MPELASVFRRWLDRQPAAANIVIVGGGKLADVVREYDRLHSLSDSQAHWLAIRTMELNSRVLSSLLPEATWLDSLTAAVGWDKRGCERRPTKTAKVVPLAILNPYNFMVDDSSRQTPLPATWSVTSDSIAACAAEHTGALELVLLKSALPADGSSLNAAVSAGFIDSMFPEVSRCVPSIRCVNLRGPTFPEFSWRTLVERPQKE